MEEDNVQTEGKTPDLGKFKSVDALLKAYTELEAEFTRRSRRLKALEENKAAETPIQEGQATAPSPEPGKTAESGSEALYRAVMDNEEVRAHVLSDYLRSLRGVPLMTGGGGVPAPGDRPKTLAEAGKLALGYLKKNH